MADRASKRLRRIDSESDDIEGVDDRASSSHPSAAPTASSTRPRRGTTNQPPPAAVIERSSPEQKRQSIHLTVKASPNKLRKATSGNTSAIKTAVSSRHIVSGKRASRNSRVVREVDSDDEEDEEDEEEEDEEEVDAMDVDDEDEEEDEDAEGEEDDDVDAEGEEDEEMEDLTPAPRIVVSSNEQIRVKPPAPIAKAQDTVEAKEMAMADEDDDDEELSELDSEEEEDAEGEDEDAEGEEDDEMPAQNDDEDEDEDMDSDDGTPSMSRSHTPDLSKLTRRQRAMHVEDSDGSLLALSNEAQKKKHLTAEEHAMRRAEMARRRKNLSEKRNEEEKMNTIDRLLKKQPPKRGRKAMQEATGSGEEDELEVEKAHPLYVRYIQNESGTRMAVPDEWLQAPAGSIFAGSLAKSIKQPFGRRMVEEVA